MKERRQQWLLAAAGIQLTLLTILAYWVAQSKLVSWDLMISRNLQSFRTPLLDQVMFWISYPGFPPQLYLFLFIMIAILLIKKRYLETKIELGIFFLVGWLGYLFKWLVNRPRPSTEEINYIVHKGLEGGRLSFPAGHTQSYLAILGFLWWLAYRSKNGFWRSFQLIFYSMMIIFIGPSRVYMGEHWTSDVIGGYLVGGIILSLAIYYYGKKLT